MTVSPIKKGIYERTHEWEICEEIEGKLYWYSVPKIVLAQEVEGKIYFGSLPDEIAKKVAKEDLTVIVKEFILDTKEKLIQFIQTYPELRIEWKGYQYPNWRSLGHLL